MSSSSKPLASLSSGLLARPGAAKPAMRPQAFSNLGLEDLGWNDMGNAALTAGPDPEPAPIPSVLTERAKLADAVAAPKPSPATKVAAPKPMPARKKGTVPIAAVATGSRKAAFTLRLDADRHLRLRLASAVDGRSSQQLVVQALDAFLAAQPDVETLARQVPASQRPPLEI